MLKRSKKYMFMGKVAYFISAAMMIAALVTNLLPPQSVTAEAGGGTKYYVCKYVGTPGVNETLQTGQNPILVNENALPSPVVIGGYFNDSHGRSYVLGPETMTPVPTRADCPVPPPPATASVSIGTCYYATGSSLTPVTYTLDGASLTITKDGTSTVYGPFTVSGTINLPPGSYTYSWTAQADHSGTGGSGGFTINDCTPGAASALVVPGSCSYATGSSLTPVTYTLDGASLTITKDGTSTSYGPFTVSGTINLPPGNYSYSWTPQPDHSGTGGSGTFVIGDCTPGAASASLSLGSCTWTAGAGSLTPVTYTLDGASLTITKDGTSTVYGPFTVSGTINLPPGNYSYSWTPQPDHSGTGGSGTLVVGACTPPNATASVSTGTCSWTQAAGSLTPVTITLSNASLTINGVTYTTSQTINLPPGSYPYTWTALPGYIGSGSGTVVVGDCTPGNATADVSTLACTWTQAGGSLTPVTITLNHASFTINGQTYTESTTIYLPPGDYDYTWTAVGTNYTGSGTGVLHIGACVPPPVPAVNVSCYSLEFHAYRTNIGNSGPAGEIGYSTNLNPTIISLGVITSGGRVQISVPSTATTLYIYPMGPNGWGTPIQVALSTLTIGICEDPLELSSFCSYVDPNKPHGWTVTNVNAFPVVFTWVYGSLSSPAPIPLAAGASNTFTTADQPGAEMQIFADGILMASGAPAAPCPTEPPSVDACPNLEGTQANVPDGYQLDNSGNCVAVQQTLVNPVVIPIPVTVPKVGESPTILIPVTGVDKGMLGRTLPGTLFGLSFSFAGLGLLLCGFALRRQD